MISKYDIICLCECWINPYDEIHLDGYNRYVCPRKVKGGGIVIFYKCFLNQRITLYENFFDSVICLKVECVTENPIFLMFCYIPPENSTFYEKNDVNFFLILEQLYTKVKNSGDVYIFGDFNARTADYNDYIMYDTLPIDGPILNMFDDYFEDLVPTKRKNMDKCVNTFGRYLLEFCKSTGVRIANGRVNGDECGSITFYSKRGFSLIDYVITENTCLSNITEFESGTFSEFSDHSPVSFCIPFKDYVTHNTPSAHVVNNGHGRVNARSVKWRNENCDIVNECLIDILPELQNILDSKFDSIDDVNTCVDNFCVLLNSCILPFCEVHESKIDHDYIPKSQNIFVEDKPWFTEKCKSIYLDYKKKLKVFNADKTPENRESLTYARRIYKRFENKLKREYKRHEGDMLAFLRKHNPKQFYKLFKTNKSKHPICNLTLDDFSTHFKNLSACATKDIDDNGSVTDTSYEELDIDISTEEIQTAIKKLKTNKSSGEDCIVNEIFIKCQDRLIPYLHKLFNNIFHSGFYPESWSKSAIIPIYKKGDANDPNNYRGISIVSCFGKLFTSILNNRILLWERTYDILSDSQFGFRKGLSTIDAIFVLQSLVNKYLSDRKRLYCCFIDFQKAFDSVDRVKLWHKIFQSGVQGKMLKIIRSLYNNVKSCVKYKGILGEYFSNKVGLMQGETLSPLLFSLYVNDFEKHFMSDNCPSVELQVLNLFVLMYADDMVIFADSPEGLQKMLNSVHSYTDEWSLRVNVEKTKVVVFRNGGKIHHNEHWIYDNVELEIVNEFKYLGLLFNYNGKFLNMQKHAAEQGRKALFALTSKFKKHEFNVETLCSVFDTYVCSVFLYGSELWGFHKCFDVEKVHLNFCKNILSVGKKTANNMVYFELGRLPLTVKMKLRIFKYWLKLKTTDNCVLKSCYENLVARNDKWILHIKNELTSLGLNYIWSENHVEFEVLSIIKQRLLDVHKQNILENITKSSKGHLYQHLIDNFCLQTYLTKPIDKKYKRLITKFRLSNHLLNIEIGRHHKVSKSERLCTCCNLHDIEDEFHFILKCPLYSDLRKQFLKKYYYLRPSVFKLIKLLSSNNVSELLKLGKFLSAAILLRQSHSDV